MRITNYIHVAAWPILLLSFIISAQAQLPSPCHTDSAGYVTTIVRNDNPTIPCYQFCTQVDSCSVIRIPSNLIGTVFFGAFPIGMYEALLVDSCNIVRADTCILITQVADVVRLFRGSFGANGSIAICGPAADIYIRCEFDPAYAMPFPALMLLDTLCPQVSITPQEIDSRSFQYHDLRGIPHLPPLQSGMYIRNTVGTNERVKIVVSDH